MGACSGCGRPLDAALDLCPACGTPRKAARKPALAGGRTAYYALALAALIGVTVLLRRATREPAAYGVQQVEWLVDRDHAPRDPHPPSRWLELHDPDHLPGVAVVRIRSTGDKVYADSSQDHANLAIPVWQELRAAGTNAYYDEPARQIARDRYEVTTVGVVVQAEKISPEMRSKYFAGGRACIVYGVTAGSPVEQAGLAVGDVLLTIGGSGYQAGEMCDSVTPLFEAVPRGSATEILVARAGVEQTIRVTRPQTGRYGLNYWSGPLAEEKP